jgi:hypothetical protein
MASFGYAQPPLALRHPRAQVADGTTVPGDLRDIDVIGIPYESTLDEDAKIPIYRPHPIDLALTTFIDRTEDPEVLELLGHDEQGASFSISASAELLTPRERLLDGVQLRTPLIGVQQWIENILRYSNDPPEERAKYEASANAFDIFADEMRAAHPEEFLPDTVMEPLIELAIRNAG